MNVGDCYFILFDDEGSLKDVENWVKIIYILYFNRNIVFKKFFNIF